MGVTPPPPLRRRTVPVGSRLTGTRRRGTSRWVWGRLRRSSNDGPGLT